MESLSYSVGEEKEGDCNGRRESKPKVGFLAIPKKSEVKSIESPKRQQRRGAYFAKSDAITEMAFKRGNVVAPPFSSHTRRGS